MVDATRAPSPGASGFEPAVWFRARQLPLRRFESDFFEIDLYDTVFVSRDVHVDAGMFRHRSEHQVCTGEPQRRYLIPDAEITVLVAASRGLSAWRMPDLPASHAWGIAPSCPCACRDSRRARTP